MEYFLEALQAYFAPVTMIVFMTVFIVNDKLFEKRIKKLFLLAIWICLIIIAATWTDRVLSVCSFNGAWYLRRVTSCVNFLFSPFAPAVLVSIYKEGSGRRHSNWFYLPLVINAAACFVSIFTGWIFGISECNVYKRGALFVLPFATALFYMLSLIFFAMRQKKQSKRIETVFLTGAMLSIASAAALEVFFVVRYMIWSTTTAIIVLYYTILSVQRILYDPLSGAFTRSCYLKALDTIDGKKNCEVSLIDINNLKAANDRYGHACGDELIAVISQTIMRRTSRRSKLYRIGGDEFVLLTPGRREGITEDSLEKILNEDFGGKYNDKLGKISFAYGTAEYVRGEDLQAVIQLADSRMYEKKKVMKLAEGQSVDEKV